MAKGKKTGGRQPGSPNKRTFLVEEIAAKCKVDPFQVLMWAASGDWEKLGFDGPTSTVWTKAGPAEVKNISLDQRISAAREAAKYLYAQKQSVAVSSGDTGIKIIVEDYSKKDD